MKRPIDWWSTGLLAMPAQPEPRILVDEAHCGIVLSCAKQSGQATVGLIADLEGFGIHNSGMSAHAAAPAILQSYVRYGKPTFGVQLEDICWVELDDECRLRMVHPTRGTAAQLSVSYTPLRGISAPSGTIKAFLEVFPVLGIEVLRHTMGIALPG